MNRVFSAFHAANSLFAEVLAQSEPSIGPSALALRRRAYMGFHEHAAAVCELLHGLAARRVVSARHRVRKSCAMLPCAAELQVDRR